MSRLYMGYVSMRGKPRLSYVLRNEFFCEWYDNEDIARSSWIKQATNAHPLHDMASHAVYDITEIAENGPNAAD